MTSVFILSVSLLLSDTSYSEQLSPECARTFAAFDQISKLNNPIALSPSENPSKLAIKSVKQIEEAGGRAEVVWLTTREGQQEVVRVTDPPTRASLFGSALHEVTPYLKENQIETVVIPMPKAIQILNLLGGTHGAILPNPNATTGPKGLLFLFQGDTANIGVRHELRHARDLVSERSGFFSTLQIPEMLAHSAASGDMGSQKRLYSYAISMAEVRSSFDTFKHVLSAIGFRETFLSPTVLRELNALLNEGWNLTRYGTAAIVQGLFINPTNPNTKYLVIKTAAGAIFLVAVVTAASHL